MSMLLFIPWCQIDKPYRLDPIKIIPFVRDNPIQGLDDDTQSRVNMILEAYKTIDRRPVERAAIIQYSDRPVTDDLEMDELELAYDLITLVCFCGLSKRDYFNPIGFYCNSDNFTVHTQKFDRDGFTGFVSRRRDGINLSGWSFDEISITIPVHCSIIREISIDDQFLAALVDYRGDCPVEKWARWQNAISCFNQANTDSDTVRYQSEWVLMASAFEHLLGAKSNYDDVARKFTAALEPSEPVLVCDAARRSDRWANENQPLRHEWMREFYRIRNDFAHGRMDSQQPTVWEPTEHLFLAVIAFPLIIKSILANKEKYELTDYDKAQIDGFEKFADTKEFMRPPSKPKRMLDSHWRSEIEARRVTLTGQRAANKAWDELNPEQQKILEGESNEGKS